MLPCSVNITIGYHFKYATCEAVMPVRYFLSSIDLTSHCLHPKPHYPFSASAALSPTFPLLSLLLLPGDASSTEAVSMLWLTLSRVQGLPRPF